jgi:hypothetical protein
MWSLVASTVVSSGVSAARVERFSQTEITYLLG